MASGTDANERSNDKLTLKFKTSTVEHHFLKSRKASLAKAMFILSAVFCALWSSILGLVYTLYFVGMFEKTDAQRHISLLTLIAVNGGLTSIIMCITKMPALIRIGEGEVLVHLRAVAGVRLVARTPARESQGFKIALVQEVPEWGGKDDLAVAYGRYGARISTGRLNIRKSAGGGLQASLEQEDVPEWDSEGGTTVPERLEKEIEYLKMLFSKCGALQRNNRMMTGCDFFSKTFQERTKEVAQTLQDVPLLALGHATDNFGQQLREAIVASHAAVAAFSVHMRTQFVCEPTSIFPRLKRIKEFLLKAHNLLSARSVCREIESERDGNN